MEELSGSALSVMELREESVNLIEMWKSGILQIALLIVFAI